MPEDIILVNRSDHQIGTMEKLQAHREGRLHRAFSLYIFNSQGQLMLQQRALDKYHCGGLWTNTTCSHPRAGEALETAVHRRLQDEMGFDTELKKATELIYHVPFDNGLTEHEYLHVYTGLYDHEPRINPEEAADWMWIDMDVLRRDIEDHPERYTYWLRVTLPEFA